MFQTMYSSKMLHERNKKFGWVKLTNQFLACYERYMGYLQLISIIDMYTIYSFCNMEYSKGEKKFQLFYTSNMLQ